MQQPWTESMDGTKAKVLLSENGFQEDDFESPVERGGFGVIIFQHGPIQEVGRNGTTIETVITVLINRLEGFQRGPFANEYNTQAIVHLTKAKDHLEDRTRDRQAREVEGTDQP